MNNEDRVLDILKFIYELLLFLINGTAIIFLSSTLLEMAVKSFNTGEIDWYFGLGVVALIIVATQFIYIWYKVIRD